LTERRCNLQNVTSSNRPGFDLLRKITEMINGCWGDHYVLVQNKLVIVDQHSRRVVAIVPASPDGVLDNGACKRHLVTGNSAALAVFASADGEVGERVESGKDNQG